MVQTISKDIDYTVCELSIQINLNGFSFCIKNENKSIEVLEQITFTARQTPEKLLERLKGIFEKFTYLSKNYRKVAVIYQNELFTLVPKETFDPDQPELYLQYSVRTLANDFVAYDDLENEEVVVVYVPYVNINNFFFEKYGSFSYYHSQTIFLRTILSQPQFLKNTQLLCNVFSSSFELLVLQDGKVQLMNSFIYESKEDFLYYILFAAEQLDLKPENMNLYFLGISSKENPLYLIAEKYVRNINLIKLDGDTSSKYSLDQLQQYFTLLNTDPNENYIRTL